MKKKYPVLSALLTNSGIWVTLKPIVAPFGLLISSRYLSLTMQFFSKDEFVAN